MTSSEVETLSSLNSISTAAYSSTDGFIEQGILMLRCERREEISIWCHNGISSTRRNEHAPWKKMRIRFTISTVTNKVLGSTNSSILFSTIHDEIDLITSVVKIRGEFDLFDRFHKNLKFAA